MPGGGLGQHNCWCWCLLSCEGTAWQARLGRQPLGNPQGTVQGSPSTAVSATHHAAVVGSAQVGAAELVVAAL